MAERCINCKFYNAEGVRFPECRFYPPQLFMKLGGNNAPPEAMQMSFALTHPNFWCGQFKQKILVADVTDNSIRMRQ